MHVIFLALRAGLSDSSEDDQSGLHHPGLTLLAPQVVCTAQLWPPPLLQGVIA